VVAVTNLSGLSADQGGAFAVFYIKSCFDDFVLTLNLIRVKERFLSLFFINYL